MALTSSSSPHLHCTSEAGQSQLFGVRSPPILSARFTCHSPPLPGGSLPVGKAAARPTHLNFDPVDLVDRSLALWSCCWKAVPAASSLPLPCIPSAAGTVGQRPRLALGGSAALLPDSSALPAREPAVCGNSNCGVGASQFFFFNWDFYSRNGEGCCMDCLMLFPNTQVLHLLHVFYAGPA